MGEFCVKKSLGCALALGAAALPAAGLGVSEYFMRVAVDRDPPRRYARAQENKKPEDDPYAAFEPDWERLRNSPHERVEIRSHDGLRLVGHWFPAAEAKRVILAVHGWRSRWYKDFCGICRFWSENDCSVLYIEQRAQGESEGKYMGFGLLEREDCLDWLRWLEARCGTELPVYLAGISMGASTVLLLADRELPAQVRGITADCGFTSPDAIWEHVAHDGFHLPYRLLRGCAALLFWLRTGLLPDAASTTEALRKTRLPVLLVHGEDDDFVPPAMSRENYEACAGPKTLLTVPGAIHGLSYTVDKAGYQAAVRRFWEACEG